MEVLNEKPNQQLRKNRCMEIDHRKNTSLLTWFGLPKVPRKIKSRTLMLSFFSDKKNNVGGQLDETETAVSEGTQSENEKVNTNAFFRIFGPSEIRFNQQ